MKTLPGLAGKNWHMLISWVVTDYKKILYSFLLTSVHLVERFVILMSTIIILDLNILSLFAVDQKGVFWNYMKYNMLVARCLIAVLYKSLIIFVKVDSLFWVEKWLTTSFQYDYNTWSSNILCYRNKVNDGQPPSFSYSHFCVCGMGMLWFSVAFYSWIHLHMDTCMWLFGMDFPAVYIFQPG